jgi:anti-sigma regulatory factor (Ser/Thr protein kinase)
MTVSTHARPRGHPGYSETMPCAPESAATARSLIRTALGAWGLGRLEDDGILVVTEFVSNAARHTDGHHIRVAVSRPTRNTVRIQVTDRSRALPVRHSATPDDTRGRGLEIVDALTARWGTEHLPWGKRVWCELNSEVSS